MHYEIRRARVTPEFRGDWDGPAWRDAQVASINFFLPESSDHHPRAEAKVVYDDSGLYVHFRVFDRYVVCKRVYHQEITAKDSCVEVYFEPFPGQRPVVSLAFRIGN